MSNALWWEFIIMIPAAIFGGYLVLWSVPGAIMSAMVSLGDIERIVFIDKQLAKNLSKYYDERGYMRWDYQMSYSIGTRLFGYWLVYPFIKHRVTTRSKKFRLFMWVNCIGVWSFFYNTVFRSISEMVRNYRLIFDMKNPLSFQSQASR